MYTELVIKCEIKSNVPDEVKAVLRFLFAGGPEPVAPDHVFFKCPRWRMVGAPSWPRVIWCRMRGHPAGVYWYTSGMEPDMRCKGCLDDIG